MKIELSPTRDFEKTFGLHYDDFVVHFGVTFGTVAPSASRNLPGAARGNPGQPPEMVHELPIGGSLLSRGGQDDGSKQTPSNHKIGVNN